VQSTLQSDPDGFINNVNGCIVFPAPVSNGIIHLFLIWASRLAIYHESAHIATILQSTEPFRRCYSIRSLTFSAERVRLPMEPFFTPAAISINLGIV
jgi:hypothetical protein